MEREDHSDLRGHERDPRVIPRQVVSFSTTYSAFRSGAALSDKTLITSALALTFSTFLNSFSLKGTAKAMANLIRAEMRMMFISGNSKNHAGTLAARRPPMRAPKKSATPVKTLK